MEANGLKVGFLAYSDFHDIFWSFAERFTFAATQTRAGMAPAVTSLMAEDVRRMKKSADFVVVSVHWGQEYMRFPDSSQVDRAHALVDAGADVVFGHHPHVLQPVECYKGALIFYSLGNFVFDQEGEKETESMIATVSLRKGMPYEAELVPMRIIRSRPAPMEGAEAEGSVLAMAKDSAGFNSRVFSRGGRMYLSSDGRRPDLILKRIFEENRLIFPNWPKGRQ
jgi:poly-gamma-glutamate synthesis protein (capsule biosynthesis protein)